LGQGGFQALEDAAALGVVVRHFGHRNSKQSMERAFRAFEAIRFARTARLQKESRVFGGEPSPGALWSGRMCAAFRPATLSSSASHVEGVPPSPKKTPGKKSAPA
jgi:2-polyprenyl-6-methoxyphenol hydroxylase-like FAD-dependent oxidoreductase